MLATLTSWAAMILWGIQEQGNYYGEGSDNNEALRAHADLANKMVKAHKEVRELLGRSRRTDRCAVDREAESAGIQKEENEGEQSPEDRVVEEQEAGNKENCSPIYMCHTKPNRLIVVSCCFTLRGEKAVETIGS